MTKLPRLTSNEMIKFLESNKTNVYFLRQTWSHKMYKNKNNWWRIVLSSHPKKIIHPKIIKEILIVLEITLDEFVNMI